MNDYKFCFEIHFIFITLKRVETSGEGTSPQLLLFYPDQTQDGFNILNCHLGITHASVARQEIC